MKIGLSCSSSCALHPVEDWDCHSYRPVEDGLFCVLPACVKVRVSRALHAVENSVSRALQFFVEDGLFCALPA